MQKVPSAGTNCRFFQGLGYTDRYQAGNVPGSCGSTGVYVPDEYSGYLAMKDVESRYFGIAAAVILVACTTVVAFAQAGEEADGGPAESPCQTCRNAGAGAAKNYIWTDADGVVHFSDSVPPEFAAPPGACLNHPGVASEQCESKRAEERAAQAVRRRSVLQEVQRRADPIMLRDHLEGSEDGLDEDLGVDGCHGQKRVIQMYIRNLQHRLDCLKVTLDQAKPDASLLRDIRSTKETMQRQLRRLGDSDAYQDWCQHDLRYYQDIPSPDRYEVEQNWVASS